MHDFQRIEFSYPAAEAEHQVVAWCLRQLDLKLSGTDAKLIISDMKFGRAGLEVSWDLTGDYSRELEAELEREFEWICRRVVAS